MRYGIALAVAVAIAIAVYFATRGREASAPSASPGSAGSATTSASPAAHAPERALPPRHVTTLASAEERARVASEIAAARAARAHAAPAPPSLPAQHEVDVKSYAQGLQRALQDVTPYLDACYDAARGSGARGERTAMVRMSLVGDRDVGTLIDTGTMVDANQQPLEPDLASCLKTTLESLELPPLAEGDELKIQYRFQLGD